MASAVHGDSRQRTGQMAKASWAQRALVTSAAVAASAAFAPAVAGADVWGTQFETSAYAPGDVDGQGGRSKTGPYDANIANVSSFPDASTYGFGTKSLQISNAVTGGSFSD